MKTPVAYLSTLVCLVLLWVVSCKKTDGPAPTPTPTPTTKSAAKDIAKFTFAALSPAVDATIDAAAKTISATVPAGTDVTKLVPTITISDKATVSPNTGVAQDFSKEVAYTVTAEDASTQVWKVTVKVIAPVFTSNLSDDIKKIVTQAQIDLIKSRGMPIYESNTVSKIDGIYELNPDVLVTGYNSNDYKPGELFSSYRYQFTNHDTKAQTVSLDYSNKDDLGADAAKGYTSYISGAGNKFTAFVVLSGISSSIPYKTLVVISGEMTSTGIKDFQLARLLTEKTGDTNDVKLVAVGSLRTFKDGDGLASKVDTIKLRIGVNEPSNSTDGKVSVEPILPHK